jgi:hypothetical protein
MPNSAVEARRAEIRAAVRLLKIGMSVSFRTGSAGRTTP